MLGIITKDLYQNFYILKQRLTFIANYAVIFLGTLLIKNIYGLIFSTLIWIPFVLAPILLQVASERDEKTNYYKILLAMPVTKKDIINARYCLGLFFTILNAVISLIGILIHIYLFNSINFTQGLYIFTASFLLSLISLAANYLSYIVLGSRGIFVNATIVTVVLIGYYFNPPFLEGLIKTIIQMKPSTLVVKGFIIAAISLIFSYLCSILYYSKKDIG